MTVLAHTLVTAPGAAPGRLVLVLHGILGSRSNWRTVAKKMVKARPEWGACLVDLRMHGDSQEFSPPHSVSAAAHDLIALEGELSVPVTAVLGHSFGGKVALAYAQGRAAPLESLVLVDSMPGPRPGGRGSESTLGVVAMLRELPRAWSSRKEFVDAVVGRGQSTGLGQWLAMNLERNAEGDGFALRLDLDAISTLLDDYFAIDLWPVLESPSAGCRVGIVVGGASSVFEERDLARARELADARAETMLDVIEGAGHWVHAEAPDALVASWIQSL
jgi:esterase